MEPLPLIPRIENTVTPEMGYLVREVFQNAFQEETATWRISINLSKSCGENPDLKRIAAKIQTEIIDHKKTLDGLENAEIQIMESQGYHLCRDQKMRSNERAMEIIRLKRHPLYIDLHPNVIEKYPLLQSDDLLPPTHERDTGLSFFHAVYLPPTRHAEKFLIREQHFRLDNRDRIKMKKRLYRSKDSLLDEMLTPHITRVCRFDTITEQKTRNRRSKERSSMIQMATRNRSIIKSEYLKTVLVAEPDELFFHNFEYNKTYKKNVLIKNVSNSMARYKIEKRSRDSKFIISCDTIATTQIAPGMHLRLTILFLCNVIEDPEEFLIVNVQFGKTVCIKMRGYRDPPLLREAVRPLYQICSRSVVADMENGSLSFSSNSEEGGDRDIHETQATAGVGNIEIYGKGETSVRRNVNLGGSFECGRCFVGERIVLLTRFVNEGGGGKFFIMSEIDWCTMNIDDIMDCNMILIPPFAMWPIYFTLRSGEYVEIRTYFYPESYGMQVDKLYILCDNHAIHPIEVIGDGILYEPSFVRFGDIMEKVESSEDGNRSVVHYCLNIGDAGSDGTVENLVHVTNTSGLEMYYRWEKGAAKHSTSSPESSWMDLRIENVEIQPSKGSLNRNSITSFKIVVQTKDLNPSDYRAVLRFYIEDIPRAAVPKDRDWRITECCVKRRNCAITVDVLVADIEVCVQCTPEKVPSHTDISEKTESDTRYLDEAGEKDNDSCSSSTNAVQNPYNEFDVISDKPFICGTENVKCNEYHDGTENSENLGNASLDITKNFDVDTGAPAFPRVDFHHQTANTAILIPDRPLYVGIEQAFTLTLRNLICKPLSYAWGQPLVTDRCKMKLRFDPDRGSIPPTNAATMKVTCLPMDTGRLDNFFVPCFVGGQKDPITLGIECTIDALYVTFLFLPAPNINSSPCVDSVRVEWHKGGHESALNLNNLKMNRNSEAEEEQELKNIDLDAGQVVATAAVGPGFLEGENVSLLTFPKTPTTAKRQLDKNQPNKAHKKSVKKSRSKDNAAQEPEQGKVDSPELRSWISLLEGIVWTEDSPDEFITLTDPHTIVPFHKTIVPPITQALAIEFLDLPLRTVRKRTFVIRNETPAESTFLITLKQFGPSEVIKESNPKDTIDAAYANVMGRKSENYWEKIKPPGQSIVLVIEPTSGDLAPFETVPIDIYVYADTWGIYVDEITVAIVGLPDYIFGICTQVVGSPIAYPICKTGLNQTPVLRFGSLTIGRKSVTRKISIENTSSVMLAVNWYCYLIDSPLTENQIPFNIILQMFSPLTNKVANAASTGLTNDHKVQKISTVNSATKESQRSILGSDESDSDKSIEINSLPSNFYHTEVETETSQSSTSNFKSQDCCSESPVLSDRILSRDGKREAESSFRTDYLNDEYTEYTTESETNSSSLREGTIEKETDLELSLTPYYGEPDFSMFTVSPAELVIPVEGKRWIEITLNIPNDEFGIENCKNEVLARLMGFVRVAPMNKYKADCYSRSDGTTLTPTEIQLEAIIIQPTLSYEIAESDRTFKFFAPGPLAYFHKEIEINRKYMFKNNEQEAMFINAQSTDPFCVLSLSTMKSRINPSEFNGISVEPGQCVEVEILCSVDASWIDEAMEMNRYQNGENSYIDIARSLVINHVGSCNQVVSLWLRIYLPLLRLSTREIKFGMVYIGDSKRTDLVIENISSDKQILNIRAKSDCKDFGISPNQGVLSHKGSKLHIGVNFTPSEPEKSIEVLEISTGVADYIEECIIEGCGSWDEECYDSSK